MRTPIINVMDRAARRAGRALARDFGEVQQLQASRKGVQDFVAAAVRKASQTLRYELEKARPAFAYADAAGPTGDGHRWIVSALDGETNFAHGLPHFALSLAHQDNGTIVESLVYDPLREEVFWAARNTGAFVNDARLRVSARQHLSDAVIAIGMPAPGQGEQARFLATFEAVLGAARGVRSFGVPALDLAYVAAGRFDGALHLEAPPAEFAAGILIVREAGGFVSDAAGGDAMLKDGTIIAANDRLHDPLLACIGAAISALRDHAR